MLHPLQPKNTKVKYIYPHLKTMKIQLSLEGGNIHPLRAKPEAGQKSPISNTNTNSSQLQVSLVLQTHSCSSLT